MTERAEVVGSHGASDDELFYTVSEVAIRWKRNPKTVRRMIKSGELPATQIGQRGIRVSYAAVLAVEQAGAANVLSPLGSGEPSPRTAD